MFELVQTLSAIELFPFSGADLTANSVHVKNLFRKQQAIGLESNVIDVIIPPGMLSERAEVFSNTMLTITSGWASSTLTSQWTPSCSCGEVCVVLLNSRNAHQLGPDETSCFSGS